MHVILLFCWQCSVCLFFFLSCTNPQFCRYACPSNVAMEFIVTNVSLTNMCLGVCEYAPTRKGIFWIFKKKIKLDIIFTTARWVGLKCASQSNSKPNFRSNISFDNMKWTKDVSWHFVLSLLYQLHKWPANSWIFLTI